MTHAPHIPVLAREMVTALAPRDGARVIDATFGAGGYSRALLGAAACHVFGIDRDPAAVAIGRALEAVSQGRFHMVEGRFSRMDRLMAGHGVERVEGVAFDLGVSSMQLDVAARGFSFQADGPLDMRMSGAGESAGDVVNGYGEAALADLIHRYGEEPKARRIARAIVAARSVAPITRTLALANVVQRAIGRPLKGVHPATRTFQALRIHVNRELDELEAGLAAAERLLAPEGRLAVVSFHSLEDRIVKRFFDARCGRAAARRPSRHLPVSPNTGPAPSFSQPQRRALVPQAAEVAANARARSAKLRWAIRTDAPAWAPREAA
ncbi:MAG: 16S rRNA (cytosine(1402)-N(4))-methyltransferase RsmH [Pseudomonadota bacterium]|jgi:16S rRNA (cytosine1402-N4)-methyltransferase